MSAKFSPSALKKAQKAVAREAAAKKNTFKIGDAIVTKDPFEKHKTRGGTVIGFKDDLITVQFTSTKGSSYSKDTSENRKVVKVGDSFVALTNEVAHLPASALQHRKTVS